jgi:methionine sulfoxide reductase heme-binding subunit
VAWRYWISKGNEVLHNLLAQTADDLGHDAGVRELAQISARLAYAMMCLTLTWGVLTSMGWVSRLAGRPALRSSHLVLATLTLAFAGIHLLAFLLLRINPLRVTQVLNPFYTGAKISTTMAILAFEGMLAAAVVVGLRRWMSYWRWLWIHRLAYPAFALGVGHSLLGAMANGHLAILWLGGITLLIPAVTVAVIRFLPTRALATAGLIEAP